jgi:hypothetical protein
MQTIKRVLVALILVVALPVSVMADTVVEFGDLGQGQQITSVSGDIPVGLVGPNLQFTIGEDDSVDLDGNPTEDFFGGETSVVVPAGAIGAVVHDDGTVSFTVPDPMPVPVVIDAPAPVELLTEDEVAELDFDSLATWLELIEALPGMWS